MISQNKTRNILEKTLFEIFGKNYRIIKLSGGKFQEVGLPDFLILTPKTTFWIEAKNSWTDTATKMQKRNIKTMKRFNIRTGFIVGNEIKEYFDDKDIIPLKEWLIKND